MDRDPAIRREFLRRVYRAAADGGLTRDSYLDGLYDAVQEAISQGKELIASSGGGVSASYQVFSGWNVISLIRLIDWARDRIGPDVLADSLSGIPSPAYSVAKSYTGVTL